MHFPSSNQRIFSPALTPFSDNRENRSQQPTSAAVLLLPRTSRHARVWGRNELHSQTTRKATQLDIPA
jgi:hypothetical protein